MNRRVTAPLSIRFSNAVTYDMRKFVFRFGIALALTASAAAQVTWAQCRPPANSHEAKLLAFYGVPLVFSADPIAIAPDRPRLSVSLEGAYVPTPSATLQHTETCYTGRVQHTNLTSFFGRPRLAVSLPGGFGLEASYLPPIKVSDATPNLRSFALWYTYSLRDAVALTLRAHTTRGTVHGPITCPKGSLQQSDPNGACYSNTPSDDEFRPNQSGGELLASIAPWGRDARVQLNAGVGVNALRPRFQVGFSDLSGGTDHTAIAVNLTRVTGLLGATVKLNDRCHVATQGYTSFGDATTVRGLIGCALVR